MTADERARARALLDLQEGRGPVPVLDDAGVARLLSSARRIAVVGASPNPARPSNGVLRYLVTAGYDCVPINPIETEVAGLAAYPTVTAATEAIGRFDIVDVFRRSELCVPHARDAAEARAGCLWLQLGIVSWEAAAVAHRAGLAVVMDRCTEIEVARLRGRT